MLTILEELHVKTVMVSDSGAGPTERALACACARRVCVDVGSMPGRRAAQAPDLLA